MATESQSEPLCIDRMGVAQLTKQAFDGVDLRPLWHDLMGKATDDAAGAGIGMDLSVLAQLLGDQPTGLAIQKDVLAYQRLFRVPSVKPARLRVLALAAEMDIGGNTPLEFLLSNSDIDLLTLYVVPGQPLPDPLPAHDVAIVVAPDDDASRAALAEIDRLVATAAVLNPPKAISRLDRDRLFHLLQPIAGLEIPMTVRLPRETLALYADPQRDLRAILADGQFPVIVRPVGSHAGRGLMKLDDANAIADYLQDRSEAEFFISRYVDYASADGQFRKYRLALIDGRAYACHMAISDQWKIWYLNADMAFSAEKRAEEAAFMANFDKDFALRHAAALGALSARLGLDYVTIDCAETADGKLLVFEADNTAIVHDMDSPAIFPYKPAQMRKIFDAFQAMLYNHARKSQARAA